METLRNALQAEAPSIPEPTYGVLRQLAVALEKLFEPFCEVVIHDFADFEHSIVYLAGNITDRHIGGSATDLLLAKASDGETDEDLYNYPTSLPGGRHMKSCTVFLRDADGHAHGAFCINLDISAFVAMRGQLGRFLSTSSANEIVETFTDDIEETVQNLIAETLGEIGQGQLLLNRDDKIGLIRRLDDKGVFQIKKMVPFVADQLGLSRATIYNYLREGRGENNRG
ncbi:MAG: PAS domain-containing protein [Chloroflexi bacterium]|nr:PAS domain-containing protein [Chloroflexota bacterium]